MEVTPTRSVRGTGAAVLAAVLLLLPVRGPGEAWGASAERMGKEHVLVEPADRSLRLSARIAGARNEEKRASYYKSVARQRRARNRGGGPPRKANERARRAEGPATGARPPSSVR